MFYFSDKSINDLVQQIKTLRNNKTTRRQTSTGQPSNEFDKHVATARVLVIDHDGEAVAITRFIDFFFYFKF